MQTYAPQPQRPQPYYQPQTYAPPALAGNDLASFIFGGAMPFGGVVGAYAPAAYQPQNLFQPVVGAAVSSLDDLLGPIGGFGAVTTGLQVYRDIDRGDWGQAVEDAAPYIGGLIGGPAGAAIGAAAGWLFDEIF